MGGMTPKTNKQIDNGVDETREVSTSSTGSCTKKPETTGETNRCREMATDYRKTTGETNNNGDGTKAMVPDA
jgi:hypothetical protein